MYSLFGLRASEVTSKT